jgi:hypothetical protein
MEEASPNFLSHVFNFEQDSRNDIVNIMQYTVLGIIMISLLNRIIQDYIPEVDRDKGSIAIFIEIAIQCICVFVGILFIHRVITFIPTVSGVKYAEQNIITVILPTLIVLSMISKLGEKVTILMERAMSAPQPVRVKHSQPLAQTQVPSLLPRGGSTSNPHSNNSPEPDFNTMFAGPNAPLQNSPSMDSFEPMPSNFSGSTF